MSTPVLIRFGALGDTLMLTPVFRYLARHFGTAVDFAGRGPWSRALLQGQPAVGSISELHSKRLPYFLSQDKRAMARWLGARRHNIFLDIEGDAISAALLARAGVSSDRIRRLRDFRPEPRYQHQVHTTLSRVRRCVEGCGDIDDLEASLSISVSQPWRDDVEVWLASRGWLRDEIVVVAPGNKRSMSWRPYGRHSNRKHWPVQDWAALCNAIQKRWPATRILVVGAPSEQQLAEHVERAAASEGVHAVAHDMSVPRLMALLERARCAVALDSGPAHAAAAVGCPVVCLFKATEPARFSPLARNSPVRIVTPGDVPIEEWRPGPISVDQVFAAWNEVLDDTLEHDVPFSSPLQATGEPA